MHARDQLGQGKRFDEVIVGSDAEPRNAIGYGVACGDEQDGGIDGVGAQLLDDFEPRHAGHRYVEHKQVVDALRCEKVRIGAVADAVHLEAFLAEGFRNCLEQRSVVFGDQKPHGILLRGAPSCCTIRCCGSQTRDGGQVRSERLRGLPSAARTADGNDGYAAPAFDGVACGSPSTIEASSIRKSLAMSAIAR